MDFTHISQGYEPDTGSIISNLLYDIKTNSTNPIRTQDATTTKQSKKTLVYIYVLRNI